MTPEYREVTEAIASEPFTSTFVPPPQAPQATKLQLTTPEPDGPSCLAVHSLTQLLGLHPLAGFMTVAVDTMVFSGVVVTLGALLPLAVCAGGVLGYLTYKIQMTMYHDTPDVAKTKALAVGLLTAIPSPLPYGLFIPAGIRGFIHGLRRK